MIAEPLKLPFYSPKQLADDLMERMCEEFMAKLPPELRRFSEKYPKYILKDGVVVPEPNVLKWGKWCDNPSNRVIEQTLLRNLKRSAVNGHGRVHISTVFVGVSEDCLFETMIFGGLLDEFQCRYDTMEEAKAGHQVALLSARIATNWSARRKNGRQLKRTRGRLRQIDRLYRKRGAEWAMKHHRVILAMDYRSTARWETFSSTDAVDAIFACIAAVISKLTINDVRRLTPVSILNALFGTRWAASATKQAAARATALWMNQRLESLSAKQQNVPMLSLSQETLGDA